MNVYTEWRTEAETRERAALNYETVKNSFACDPMEKRNLKILRKWEKSEDWRVLNTLR